MKERTREVTDALARLGEELGFEVEYEAGETREHATGYRARTDLVWYHRVPGLDGCETWQYLTGPLQDQNLSRGRIPVVGFEIEGSEVSSKGQVSNFANLMQGGFLYKVLVTDQTGIRERDTYHRAVGIVQTLAYRFGHQHVIPIDKLHVDAICDAAHEFKVPSWVGQRGHVPKGRGGQGGEVDEVKAIRDWLAQVGSNVGVEFAQDWRPPEIRFRHRMERELYRRANTSDEALAFYLHQLRLIEPGQPAQGSAQASAFYYIPMLDVAMGCPMPIGLVRFLAGVGKALGPAAVIEPLAWLLAQPGAFAQKKLVRKGELWLCLLGIEIEERAGKHGGAGMINLAGHAFRGLVLVPDTENATTINTKHGQYRGYIGGLRNVVVLDASAFVKNKSGFSHGFLGAGSGSPEADGSCVG